MSANETPKIKCYVAIPFDKEFRSVREAMRRASKEVGAQLAFPDEVTHQPAPILHSIYSEITRSDLVIAEVSKSNTTIFYEIGLAHAMGKPVLFLVQKGVRITPFDLRESFYFSYRPTTRGLEEFQRRFKVFLRDFMQAPRRFRPFLPFPEKLGYPSYIIDFEKLGSREFENLCFELITQMGFRRVEWGKEFHEIDVVATLPKKDPDGYEYQELWLISMGRHAPTEMILEMVFREPDYFLRHIFRHPEELTELFSRYKIRYDVPITVLFISRTEGLSIPEFADQELRRLETRLRERPYRIAIRVRWWDVSSLASLIQQYPQIAFKYFSEEARARSKYRKTPKELYEENVKLTEELLLIKNQLEEEKKKRFIAERDAAWKDVAFKAAHKLGNPIDAVDTYLQGLKRRIEDKRLNEALQRANDMETSIEEAKAVIAQFKSLTKLREISPRSTDIIPLIQQACKIAEENGVNVTVQTMENRPSPVMVDPDRIAECFNELVANALHWFNKPEKKIAISIDKPSKEHLPEILEKTSGYLRVRFEDNGCGVPLENKEKIFAPFYTTYPHGTGLGLSLVKWIIEAHGGQIHENGKPGEGTSFEMYFPIAKRRKRG
jgi:signal transduction histidine kinase